MGLCVHQAKRPEVCQADVFIFIMIHVKKNLFFFPQTIQITDSINFDMHRFSKTAERMELEEEMKEVILPRVLTNATLPRVLTNISIAQVIQ